MPTNDTIKCADVAKILGTTPMKIKHAILNGSLPIGIVIVDDDGRDRVIIPRRRWERWLNGDDMCAARKRSKAQPL